MTDTPAAFPRLAHFGIVVEDLDAAIAFFVELGLELEGKADLGGPPVDGITGLEGVRSTIAMVRTPDNGGRLELIRYHSPASPAGGPHPVSNALGLRHMLFEVANIEDVLGRLRSHGAELVGELVNYENIYWLCYVRGPAGIIVELAEKIA